MAVRMKRLLITGSRNWVDLETMWFWLNHVQSELWNWQPFVTIHGACETGSDAIADEFAVSCGTPVERYPAYWATNGKAAGPIRNSHMVSLGADFCLAFPLPGSRGTKDCYEKAIAAGVPTLVVPGVKR